MNRYRSLNDNELPTVIPALEWKYNPEFNPTDFWICMVGEHKLVTYLWTDSEWKGQISAQKSPNQLIKDLGGAATAEEMMKRLEAYYFQTFT